MSRTKPRLLSATGRTLDDLKKQYGVTNVLIGEQDGAPDRVRLARLSYQPAQIPHAPAVRERLAKRIADAFTKAVKSLQAQLPEDYLATLQAEVYARVLASFDEDSSSLLSLAASTHAGTSQQTKSKTVLFQLQNAEFKMGDVTYKFLADDYGNVFLDRGPEVNSTHLLLGNTAYRIRQTKESKPVYGILGLSAVKLLRFLADTANDPAARHIDFLAVIT